MKLLSVFAIILFFSTFTSPLLSILFTLGIYVSAHSVSAVLDMALRLKEQGMIYAAKGALAILPPFEALNVAKNTIGTPISIPLSQFAWQFVGAGLYLCLVLIATILIFERKKFENA